MVDIWSRRKRSEVMALVRSRGNKATELALARIFRRHRISGWRRNQALVGKPDFIFRKLAVALFVDGCFWHGCPRCYRRPKSNQRFWDAKVIQNRNRDRNVNRELRKLGWKVIRIWEHDLKKPQGPRIKEILEQMNSKKGRPLGRAANR